MPAITQSQNYAVFEEDRATRVRVALKEEIDGAAPSALDVSSASLLVYFRGQLVPPGTASLLVNVQMDKISGGSTGIVQKDITFTGYYGQVECQIVLVDTATANAGAPSGYKERVWKRWRATVEPQEQVA